MADTKTIVLLEIPIADFEIKNRIGHGSFGEVFLAVSKATGRYRAVKVVRRGRFSSDSPYETEFAGVKRFEEVSREHEGFVDILHVSRDDDAGYFTYVMELADDVETVQQIDPKCYVPRTLSRELKQFGRLPPQECVRVAIALIEAVGELHRRNWVHRDIKPANIIYVRGAPKLADVGLIAESQTNPHTIIGSPHYMDPDVHGSPAGDLYSFGKVLYTMSTGLHPSQWPELPDDFEKSPDLPVFHALDAIWRKACHGKVRDRYQTADEIRSELIPLRAGASVLQLKRFERTVRMVRRYGIMVLILFMSVAVGIYFRVRQYAQAQELRQRKVGSSVAYGNHALAEGDLLSALSWFAEAWRLDGQDQNALLHRMRLGSLLQHTPTLVQMWFQDRDVKEAYFAGQENQILMSDSSRQWRVYDLASGLPLYKPFGMGVPNEKISLGSRSTTALTSAETNWLCLWDYQTGAKLREFERPHRLMNAALSADGKMIAAAERNEDRTETLLLWKELDGSPTTLGMHPRKTHCLAFSPDARLLLSAGYDHAVLIWDVEAGRLITTLTNHDPVRGWVYTGTFSPDSRYVVTASFDRSVRIWEARTGVEVGRVMHDDAVFAAEFNSDNSRLVTAGLDFTARVWDTASRTSLEVLRHNSKVIRAAFGPQDKFLLTACYDDTVRVWHLRKPPAPTLAGGILALNGDCTVVHTNGNWSLAATSGAPVASLEITNESDVKFWFARDDRHFVVTFPAQEVARPVARAQCFDAQTGAPRGRTVLAPLIFANWVVSPGGQRAFAFNADAGAVWNIDSGEWIATLTNGCHLAAFSLDGKLLALARRNEIEIFDLERNFARVAVHTHPANSSVSSIEWDAEGQRLITSAWNNTLTALDAQVWTARTGAMAGPPLTHRDGVLFAAFNHDGSRVVTCGEDFLAILWDPITGRRLAPPLVHRDQVVHAEFSHDDRLVATATRDNMITIWSAESGDPLTLPLALPSAFQNNALSIRFTPDNRALIIRDRLGKSCSWDLPHYERSLEDLLMTAQLLAAQQTDSTESLMPHSKKALQQLWVKMRAKYPEDFLLPSE